MRTGALIAASLLCVSPSFAQAPLSDPSARELSAIMGERERANNQRFDAQEKAVAAALAAAKEAVVKAEAAAEKRFDSVNEFRSTLKDQQATLAPRAEMEIRFRTLDEQIRKLETRQTQIAAAADGAAWVWAVLGAVAGLAIGAVGLLISLRKSAIAPRRG